MCGISIGTKTGPMIQISARPTGWQPLQQNAGGYWESANNIRTEFFSNFDGTLPAGVDEVGFASGLAASGRYQFITVAYSTP